MSALARMSLSHWLLEPFVMSSCFSSLLSGTTRCFKFILSSPCLRLRIGHLSMEMCLFLWSIITSRPFHTFISVFITASMSMCLYFSYLHIKPNTLYWYLQSNTTWFLFHFSLSSIPALSFSLFITSLHNSDKPASHYPNIITHFLIRQNKANSFRLPTHAPGKEAS